MSFVIFTVQITLELSCRIMKHCGTCVMNSATKYLSLCLYRIMMAVKSTVLNTCTLMIRMYSIGNISMGNIPVSIKKEKFIDISKPLRNEMVGVHLPGDSIHNEKN